MGFSKVDSKTQKWSQRSGIGRKMRVMGKIVQFRGFLNFSDFFSGVGAEKRVKFKKSQDKN